MKFVAKLNNLRIAPRKSKIVADLIKGMDVDEALNQLDIHIKRTSPYMKKLLLSAISNGENNFGIDRNNMYIYDVKTNAGKTLKRWMPKAFGRAGEILKRTTHIEITLEERVEGKNRKTQEQIENERKEKEKKKILEKKEFNEKEKKKKDDLEKSSKIIKKEDKLDEKENKKGGWAKKIFSRRKSM